MNYDFNRTYYQNFLKNRVSGITSSSRINSTIKNVFLPYITPLDVEGVLCIGSVECKDYVKRTYNSDKPTCIDGKVKEELHNAGEEISTWDDWIGDRLGISDDVEDASYICTAVTKKLNKNNDYMKVFNEYRDKVIFKDKYLKQLFVKYRRKADVLVANMSSDDGVYEHVWEVYLKEFYQCIADGSNKSALLLYADMLDWLCDRYEIARIERKDLDEYYETRALPVY